MSITQVFFPSGTQWDGNKCMAIMPLEQRPGRSAEYYTAPGKHAHPPDDATSAQCRQRHVTGRQPVRFEAHLNTTYCPLIVQHTIILFENCPANYSITPAAWNIGMQQPL